MSKENQQLLNESACGVFCVSAARTKYILPLYEEVTQIKGKTRKKAMNPIKQLLFLSLAAFILAACSMLPAAATPPPEATLAPIEVSDSAIIAEGKIVPKDSVDLAYVTSGQVAEVLVQKGDLVKAGNVLARLGNRAPLEAAIAAAELELLASQQALQALYDNLEEARNQALQTLNTARQTTRDAETRVKNMSGTVSQPDIDNASAQVVFAKNALDQAKKNFAPFANKAEDNLERARLQIALADAQKKYDLAVRRYNNMTGSGNDFDRNQARTDLEIAEKRLELAQKSYDRLEAGPDADQVALAKARIASAEAQLASARAALDNLDLRATMDGTVVELDLLVGKQVSPGAAVVTLVDFSEWFVETDNLTELEVVEVALGQAVQVVPDALPAVELPGTVISISDRHEEKRGEITYTARLRLGEFDPRLRWGMTVVITFSE